MALRRRTGWTGYNSALPEIPTRITEDDLGYLMSTDWTQPEGWLSALELLGAVGWPGLSDAHETLLDDGAFDRRVLLHKLDPGTRFRCALSGRHGVVLRTSVLDVVGVVTEGVATLVLLGETVGASGVKGRELKLLRGETVVLAEGHG